MNKTTKLSYIVSPNDFLNAGSVSEDIKSNLTAMGVDPEIIRKTSLAVYECELNMIIHANGGIIEAEINPDVICVTVEDNGPGIADIEQAMEPGFTTVDPDSEIHAQGHGLGRGFSNIRKCTDAFDIETELGCGTTIHFEINLN